MSQLSHPGLPILMVLEHPIPISATYLQHKDVITECSIQAGENYATIPILINASDLKLYLKSLFQRQEKNLSPNVYMVISFTPNKENM